MAESKKRRFFVKDVYVGKRGQIVIPKDIRDLLSIVPGDHLVLVGDKAKGMAIMKPEQIKEFAEILIKKGTTMLEENNKQKK